MVCIPVTRDEAAVLPATWSSVIAHTTPETDILLLAVNVDPAALHPVLPKSTRIEIIPVPASSDPWQAVLCELPPRYAEHDILLLRPGLEVPPGWDARLALTAYRQPGIAATVPMCDSTPFLSLLESGKTDRIALARIDPLLLACSPRRDPEIPVLFSGCAYLQRAALRALEHPLAGQSAMTVGEWCQWLASAFREQGWGVVLCDHLYLLDHASGRRQREMAAMEDLEDVRLIQQAHPLTGLRGAISEQLAQPASSSPVTRSPTQLHIAHSWGGGLDYWIHQYCENDQTRNNLVLRSLGTWGAFGQRIALYRSAAMDQPLRYWDLDYPIRATAPAHIQYLAILRQIISEFGIEAILISSLIGHALDVLTTGLPTVIIAHDYYPFCPAIVIQFGEVCDHCEPERLERCFAANEQNRFFRNVSAGEWLSLRRRFARLAAVESVRFVVPSPRVARHWQRLVPALRDQSFTVIPHGLDFKPVAIEPAPVAGERLRVVILGSLARQKGRALFEQIWPLIADRVDLYLIGCDSGGETIQGQPGITIIPRYNRADLGDVLAGIQPEVGLLLSIWPETFSYTLSELWLLGIPVVATNLGSFADRIQNGVNGFLCPPQAEVIAERLLAMAADRSSLAPIREWLTGFRHRSVAEMIADYHTLIPLPEFSTMRYFSDPVARPEALEEKHARHALHVDVRVPFSQVLREFVEYTCRKLAATPRLRSWQKRGLAVLLHWILRGTTTLAQARRKS